MLQWTYMLLLLSCLCIQMIKVFPYTTLHSYQVLPATKNDPDNQLSVVYSNVLMDNRNVALALEQMNKYDPDIILAVETDHWWGAQLKPLAAQYPFYAEMPLDNTYGMILYSKLPIENKKFNFLINREIPSISPIITLRSGKKIQCYFIHPKPPAPQEAPSSLQRDAELMTIAKQAVSATLPVLVAGDLNDVGWSYTSDLFQENSRLLDPRVGRGFYATFNAKIPLMRWPLDHVFISRDFRIVALERLDYIGSDHFPIYFKLSLEPEGKEENKKLEPEDDDIEEANEKLQKQS